MNRPTEVSVTTSAGFGPSSVASRINWVLTSSHSTGTAVRSLGITAPSAIVGPVALPVRRGQLHVAGRDQVLRDDHGLGIGGHGDAAVDLRVILVWVPSGSMLSIVPTLTPDTRTSSPG